MCVCVCVTVYISASQYKLQSVGVHVGVCFSCSQEDQLSESCSSC